MEDDQFKLPEFKFEQDVLPELKNRVESETSRRFQSRVLSLVKEDDVERHKFLLEQSQAYGNNAGRYLLGAAIGDYAFELHSRHTRQARPMANLAKYVAEGRKPNELIVYQEAFRNADPGFVGFVDGLVASDEDTDANDAIWNGVIDGGYAFFDSSLRSK